MTDHVLHEGLLYECTILSDGRHDRFVADLTRMGPDGRELGVMTVDAAGTARLDTNEVPLPVLVWWCRYVAQELGTPVATSARPPDVDAPEP